MKKLNIALVGYGRMGKEIEQIAIKKKHHIIAKIDSAEDWEAQINLLKDADIAIDFSMPKTAKENILKCFELQLPVVVGTTGWYDSLAEIEEVCRSKQAAFLWSGNFSIGMNIFLKVNAYLAEMMAKFPEYQAQIHEIHHEQKLDAPSGTAISIAGGVIAHHHYYKNWVLMDDMPEDTTHILPVSYQRIGKVPGTHQVKYYSDVDEISLTHEAKNRKGFALGAVVAAEWLVGKRGVFTMNDIF